MRYPAKELKAEAYKAYSKDAFNDEERGVAYFAHGYRYAGKTGEADDILCALIDTTRYIETSLPEVDKIIITADDGSDKEIKMFPIDWFWIVDFDLINWYGMGNERSSGENRAPVSEEFYDMWENYRSRASSHKKKHPKPSAKDGIQIENCGADYFFKTNFVATRAHAEMVYKKYTHVHSEPKLEWLAVPEDRPISDLELRDYMFYERESALNLAIEISAALADFLKLDKKHGNGNMVFYNITLFELKQRLLPDLLKTNAIYFRIAIARTFIYALLNLFTDQMNSGWEDADTQTQYKKIEAWVAQLALFLRDILRKPSRPLPDEYISAFFQMRYPIRFLDPHPLSPVDKVYPKVCKDKESEPITPTSFAIFCNPEHPNVAFYLERICAYSRDLLKAKETCREKPKRPDIPRCRDFKSKIFTEVYQSISAEMGKIKNS